MAGRAPTVLLYATGGLAATELGVRNSISSSASLAQGSSNATGRLAGWTIGGGAEWALGQHWIVRGEYLYVDLGKVTTNATVEGTPFNNNMATTVDLTAHIARAGINYKLIASPSTLQRSGSVPGHLLRRTVLVVRRRSGRGGHAQGADTAANL